MADLNRNIEIIIPGKLAAVKFSFIPFIGEIEYRADDEIPAYTEGLRITDGGMFLLNKDTLGYEYLKDILLKTVPLSNWQLRRQRSKLASKKRLNTHEELCKLCLDAEMERREKLKKVEMKAR